MTSGGSIAASLAAQEALRHQRRADREGAARRERRRQLRGAGGALVAPERYDFACAWTCLSCGFLELPLAVGDPMRTEAAAVATGPHRCGRCGCGAWADLADLATASALEDNERREIDLRSGVALHAMAVAASVCIAMLGFVGMVAHNIDGILMVSTAAMGAAWGMFEGQRLRVALTTRRRRAYRWRVPTQRWSPAAAIGGGLITGEYELVAPISGRRVIGWRIEVRYPGDHGDAFALLEQRCSSLRMDGIAAPGEPTLDTVAELVTVDTPQAEQYLRSRGVDPHAVLEIRERVVLAGARVAIWSDRFGGPAIVRVGCDRCRAVGFVGGPHLQDRR